MLAVPHLEQYMERLPNFADTIALMTGEAWDAVYPHHSRYRLRL